MKNLIHAFLFLICILISSLSSAQVSFLSPEELGKLVHEKNIQLTKEGLVSYLQSEFRIQIDEADIHNSLWTESFLSYLLYYFQSIHYIPENDLTLKVKNTTKDSFWLVEYSKKTGQLIFHPKAGINIESTAFEQLKDYLKNKSPTPALYTATFSNMLFNQLNHIFLNKQQFSSLIRQNFGINTSPNINTADFEWQTEFKADELDLILRQLNDLPANVRSKMQLTDVIRMSSSYIFKNKDGEPDRSILGQYSATENSIKIGGLNVCQSITEKGEGKILHEMGHAVWEGLTEIEKNDFISLSWLSTKGQSERTTTEFISIYSMTNPKEDFAEHFAEYISNSRQLLTKCPKKYAWFFNKLFKGIRYENTVAENLKCYIESEHPDTTPPEITGFDGSYLDPQIEVIGEQIKIYIPPVEDDQSGVRYVSVNIHYTKSSWGLAMQRGCLKNTDDSYTCTFDLSDFDPEYGYYIYSLELNDNAGNKILIPVKKKTISLPKKIRQLKKQKLYIEGKSKHIVFQETKLTSTLLDDGSQMVTLSIPKTDDVQSNEIERIAFDCSYDFSEHLVFDEDIVVQDNGNEWIVSMIAPTGLPTGLYCLKEIYFKHHEVFRFDTDFYDDWKRKELRCVPHRGSKENGTMPAFNVDGVQISVLDGKNKLGGDKTIRLVIPTTGIEHPNGQVHVNIQTPTGGRIIDSESVSYSTVGDTTYFTVDVPLTPNHAAGEYMVEQISATEYNNEGMNHKGHALPNIWYYSNNSEVNLIERQIKMQIKVPAQIPEPILGR